MSSERFVIHGQLPAPDFGRWVQRHARRIGISARFSDEGPDRVTMLVEGPPALLDAMEMACLLGPIEVWVDEIRREAA